jgi:hypothetical protein
MLPMLMQPLRDTHGADDRQPDAWRLRSEGETVISDADAAPASREG